MAAAHRAIRGIHESVTLNGTLNEIPAKTAFSIGLDGAVWRVFSEVYLLPKLQQSFRWSDQKFV
jgi:hypothetical protein